MKKLLVLVLLYFFQTPCFGFTFFSSDSDLAEAAKAIPLKIIKKGINKIGNLDLENLNKKFEDPNQVFFYKLNFIDRDLLESGVGPGYSGQLRFGGHCFDRFSGPRTELGRKLEIKGGLVVINTDNIERLAANPEQLNILLLHEGLCALYGPDFDDHYQVSATLVFLSSLDSLEIKDFLVDNHKTIFENFASLPLVVAGGPEGGGITGGSGGGDPSGVFLKTILYIMFHTSSQTCKQSNTLPCTYLYNNKVAIWRALVNLRVEVDTDENTNCRTVKGNSEIPMNSFRGDLKVLHIGECQLETILRTYSSIDVAVNTTKLFWILCFTHKLFPTPSDFALNDVLNELGRL